MGKRIVRPLTPAEEETANRNQTNLDAVELAAEANETALDLTELVLALQEELEALKEAKANG